MRKKRFLAVVLAAAMVMGNGVMASASAGVTLDDTAINQPQVITGQGRVEGGVSENVFCVVVPTTPTSDSTFDYILDPQGLIASTNGARYVSGANVGRKGTVSINSSNGYTAGSLYFVNSINGTSDNKVRLSPTSDTYTITNKSTMAVDVSLNAKLVAASGSKIKVSTNKALTKADGTAMWLDIQTQKVAVDNDLADTTAGWGSGKTISGADSNYLATATMDSAKKFYVQRTSTNAIGYEYVIPSMNAAGTIAESENKYSTYNFRVTGACNEEADWSGMGSETAPTLTITYYLTEHVDAEPVAPSVQGSATVRATNNQALSVKFDMGDATSVSAITYTKTDGSSITMESTKYTFAGDTLTLTAEYIASAYNAFAGNGRQYTVEFDEGTKVVVTVTQ